jgi:hypothetical protein
VLITHILLSLLLFFPFIAQSNSDRMSVTNAITVESSRSELEAGYLKWMHLHPEVMHKNGSDASEPEPLIIRMPSIDLYSPSGVSLYHGTSSKDNAVFLHDLPSNIHSLKAAMTTDIRPSIQEAMSIFPELEPYKAFVVAKNRYTVFAMSYPNASIFMEQNKAIEQLKRRAQQLNLIVIEVQLHK